jgi:hypothetical protein
MNRRNWERTSAGRYYGRQVFAENGLTLVESKTIAAGTIFVMVTSAVDLYLSPLIFQTNDSLYFESNRSITRLEGLARAVVKQGSATLKGTLA